MNSRAMAVTLGVLGATFSGGAARSEAPKRAQGLPPGVVAQMNLGKAGLLGAYYSESAYATSMHRIGQSRTTYGAASAPGAPTSGYKDGTTALVGAISLLKALPDGKSYLRFAMNAGSRNGSGRVDPDNTVVIASASYLTFPSPDLMLGFGAFSETLDQTLGSMATTYRQAFGLRADVLKTLSDNWGFAGRVQYSVAEAKAVVNLPLGLQNIREFGDDRFYIQGQLIGQFRSKDLSMIPQGWVLRPTLGANFQRAFIETTTDTIGVQRAGFVGSTEDHGTVWAQLELAKDIRPGNWAPSISIGLEHEWVDDLGAYVDETTYGIFSVGLSYAQKSGNRFNIGYTRRQGLNGNRWSQTLLASYSINF